MILRRRIRKSGGALMIKGDRLIRYPKQLGIGLILIWEEVLKVSWGTRSKKISLDPFIRDMQVVIIRKWRLCVVGSCD